MNLSGHQFGWNRDGTRLYLRGPYRDPVGTVYLDLSGWIWLARLNGHKVFSSGAFTDYNAAAAGLLEYLRGVDD